MRCIIRVYDGWANPIFPYRVDRAAPPVDMRQRRANCHERRVNCHERSPDEDKELGDGVKRPPELKRKEMSKIQTMTSRSVASPALIASKID